MRVPPSSLPKMALRLPLFFAPLREQFLARHSSAKAQTQRLIPAWSRNNDGTFSIYHLARPYGLFNYGDISQREATSLS
jgi:hypothetical protein